MLSQLVTTLFLGFVLGIEHAFDPDHVVAVSTVASDNTNTIKAVLSGVFWGLGHTTTLLLTGVFIIFFKITIPQTVALSLEFLVGALLVFLGMQIVWKYRKKNIHVHLHSHKDKKHMHFHAHKIKNHYHHHKSSHQKKSYVIGLVHGLAGSAALMLLVLSTIRSPIAAVLYILIFGIGSVLGMMVISLFLIASMQIALKKFAVLDQHINFFAGIASIVFGVFIMSNIALS